jgi:predicted DNA-binding transcriptional regulator AlpA
MGSSSHRPATTSYVTPQCGAGGFGLKDNPVIDPSCRLLDAQEVADMLHVSPAWVRDHAGRKQPRLPVVRLGSLLRFRREDIAEWIDQMSKLAA